MFASVSKRDLVKTRSVHVNPFLYEVFYTRFRFKTWVKFFLVMVYYPVSSQDQQKYSFLRKLGVVSML